MQTPRPNAAQGSEGRTTDPLRALESGNGWFFGQGRQGAGKVVGPSFSAAEVPEVIEAVINKYLELRAPAENGRTEYFIDTLRRVGQDAFKSAANGARHPESELA